jgi:hypothetical protein
MDGKIRRSAIVVLVIISLAIISGCSTTSANLLTMSDDELLRSYYKLEDNIAQTDQVSSNIQNQTASNNKQAIFQTIASGVCLGISSSLKNERINVLIEMKRRESEKEKMRAEEQNRTWEQRMVQVAAQGRESVGEAAMGSQSQSSEAPRSGGKGMIMFDPDKTKVVIGAED